MLAAVTCFFNPCGYSKPIENYFRFRQALGSVPVFTVELSFSGQFVIPDSIRINACPEYQVLWQKERILNHGIARIPACYDKIAWLDCDLLFANQKWYTQTEEALDKSPIAQLFQNCHWLDQNGKVEKSRPSSASLGSYLVAGADKSHPGFAWAARRSQIDQWGGLFDQDITGGGDAWMAHAFFGEYETAMTRATSPMMRTAALAWCQRFRSTESIIGTVPGDVLHLHHGSLASRGYWDRFLIQQQHNFDPTTDITVAENGAWRWASPKPDFHQAVRNYFESRKEDE